MTPGTVISKQNHKWREALFSVSVEPGGPPDTSDLFEMIRLYMERHGRPNNYLKSGAFRPAKIVSLCRTAINACPPGLCRLPRHRYFPPMDIVIPH